jgi:phosphoribosylglycinamide formyltransferase-1
MKHIAIFASGTGSNFIAIYNAIQSGYLNCSLELLVSDRPKSKAVEQAKTFGIKQFAFSPKQYENKEAFEIELVALLQTHQIDLIVLAGYMRLIGPTLLSNYAGKIINIHPSLLPLYKGKDAVGQALLDQATKTGVTVHYVDSGMDTGTIIKQVECNIEPNEQRETLETKIHAIEHKIYSEVIKKLLEEM